MGELAVHRTARDADAQREVVRLSTADAAWLAAVPCAVLTALAALVLGPPVSRVLFPPLHLSFLPGETQTIRPEPLENTRYLLLLIGPALLATTVLWSSRRTLLVRRTRTRAAVAAAQAMLVALVAISLVAQHERRWGYAYFNWTTLAIALALTAATVLGIRSTRARAGMQAIVRDTPRRRLVLLGIAALATTVWLLPAVNSEASIRFAFLAHDTQFHFDETFAVLNGLTPLVDFNAQYASLLPYVIALAMRAAGTTLLVYTIAACVLSLAALLSVYDVLRRAAGNAVVGFALYLPSMATSLFFIGGISLIRFTPGVYFPMFPLRYGGAYAVAWLVARHLDRERPVRWPLFLFAGLAVLNNVEFGVAAFGATAAALLTTTAARSGRQVMRLAGAALVGLAGASALYAAFTLVRAGSLPDLARTVQFARLYGVAGFSVAPIAGVLGLPLAMFATHVAAIVTATARTCSHAPTRVLNGMLMWAGVFGLGSATYYVARSSASILPMLFSAWALSLALLAIAVLRRMAARPMQPPGTASVAVLFGVGLMACSLAQAPAPWQQVSRVQHRPSYIEVQSTRWIPPSHDPIIRRFVTSLADGPRHFAVRHGAPVAIFMTLGHRLADAYGVSDVVPYTGLESIHTSGQLDDAFDALRDAGGNTALVPLGLVGHVRAALARRGFAIVTHAGLRMVRPTRRGLPADTVVLGGLTKWVDTRHLHPEALAGG